MNFISKAKNVSLLSLFLIFSAFLFQPAVFAQETGIKTTPPQQEDRRGKVPVIVIPGLIGSELVNKTTGDTVWFSLQGNKTDDIDLPISPNIAANKDDLVAGDILRNIKYLKFLPETEIYEKLAGSLVLPGGYKEGKWDAPDADGYQDTYYVFPYDWRLDNVENARLLVRKIVQLKAKLGKPNLKFNIISHSMGGLIARYAARFGDADIPAGNGVIRPTWAGAKHLNKIFLVGTPNEGSFTALDALVNGIEPPNVAGINIPFIRRVTKFDMFTIPSVYQLLPHRGTARVFDSDLKQIQVDMFDPLTWEKYGWAAYLDPKFAKEFTPAEQQQARAYFRAVLNRARRFQQAIDSNVGVKSPVSLHLIGADCKQTLDGIIIYRDTKKNTWETIFSPESFKQNDGTKITSKQVKELLYTEGDSVVTKRSLLASTMPGARVRNGFKTAIYTDDIAFTCEIHNKLTGNADVQRKMFDALLEKQRSTVATAPSSKQDKKQRK